MPLHYSCNFCELPECQITAAQNQQQKKKKELDTRSLAKSLKLKRRVA